MCLNFYEKILFVQTKTPKIFRDTLSPRCCNKTPEKENNWKEPGDYTGKAQANAMAEVPVNRPEVTHLVVMTSNLLTCLMKTCNA